MIPGYATPAGTAAYAKRFPAAHAAHWREAGGLSLSSIGLGTYLGQADDRDDASYAAAVRRAVELGINVVDSAINYRYQRSERSIGAALRAGIGNGLLRREEILLCTKGGFLSGDGGSPSRKWWEETFVRTSIASPDDIAAGCHCMTPRYLRHEVDQSRANLGVETIDVYYLHNPETQISEVGMEEFYRRLTEAFREMESFVAQGKIRLYGVATWDAFRVPPDDPSFVSFRAVLACAREAGGPDHHFRVVQLPLNLGMPEAYLLPTQDMKTALQVARDEGITVFCSVPLLQGRLLGQLPPRVRAGLSGLETDAQRCLQFVRSTPGVTAPLCGMKKPEHVAEAARILPLPALDPERFQSLMGSP